MNKKELELYFHIPFCARKCNYCDFLSAPATEAVQEAYMEALFLECRERAEEYRDYEVVSVFIGGGTPSLVKAEWMTQLMKLVRECFQIAAAAEITIEVNPGTVDEEKLMAYKAAGINRLSIGLQSANDEELRRLGRIHNYNTFLETYKQAREAGFTNINVDVMSALPGQTLASYQETLYRLLQLSPPPEHISAYSLIVEEGTPFAQWEAEGRLDVPDEDCERLMYEETKRILGEAGFRRYEISNYAREGYECEHNCGYWKRRDYVGFGIGAASLVNNCRFHNDSNLNAYLEAPLEQRVEHQVLGVEEQMEEFMFLGLRMTEGVRILEFKQCFGRTLEEVYGAVIEANVREGLLCYQRKRTTGQEYLALTEKGLDVSNYVMAQFLFD